MLGDVVISVIVALGLIIKFRTLDKIIISILDDNPDTMWSNESLIKKNIKNYVKLYENNMSFTACVIYT